MNVGVNFFLLDKTKILKGFVGVGISYLFLFSGSFLCVSVLISSMQRALFVGLNYYNYLFYYACFVCCVFECVFCLVCFDPFNHHEDKIKGNGNRTLCRVFCFNIIIHLFFCFFFLHLSICCASQLEIELGFHRSTGVICVLAIKTVTLFNYNFLGKKYRYFVFASHLLFVVV